MSNLFRKIALPALKEIEGGYINDPDDPGGETNHGITLRVARAYGYRGRMTDLPYDTAAEIFQERYWDIIRGDDVAVLSAPIALELFEAGVHVGPLTCVQWLQEWLNGLNRDEHMYDDIAVDGWLGRMTLNALSEYLTYRNLNGESVLLNGLNASQAMHYLTREREKYLYGWMVKRVVIK